MIIACVLGLSLVIESARDVERVLLIILRVKAMTLVTVMLEELKLGFLLGLELSHKISNCSSIARFRNIVLKFR